MADLKNTINELPAPVKIIGAGVALYIVYRVFFEDENLAGGTSQNIEVDTNQLTYPENQYKIFADAIFTAVWGDSVIASWTEDDEAIASILKQMRTTDDVYQLIRAYGVRYVGVLFNSDGGNLVTTVTEYLDNDLKKEVNETYTARGIDFIWPYE